MLEGVDEVDWATLDDAYGPTVEMPNRLRALAAGAEGWETALDELYAGIFHQGSYYPATAPAARYLCELAVEPSVPTRAEILTLLTELTGAYRSDTEEGWDPFTFRSDPAPPDYPEAIATLHEIEAQAARFLPLLSDEDPRVRQCAGRLVAGLAADPPRQRDALLAALAVESDPTVMATFVVVTARLCQPGQSRDWIATAAKRASSTLVHGAVAVARAALGDVDVEALEAAALHDPVEAEVSWVEDRLPALALTALGRMEGSADTLRRVTRTWLERHGRLFDFHASSDWHDFGRSPSPAQWRRDELVRAAAAVITRSVFREYLDREEPLTVDELSEEQREIVQWTVDYGLAIPLTALPWLRSEEMACFLRGQGALSTVVNGEPLWKALYRVSALDDARQRGGASGAGQRGGKPEAADNEMNRVVAKIESLPPERIFDACLELVTHAYSHSLGWGYALRTNRHAALFACLKPHRRVLAPRFAELRTELSSHSHDIEGPVARFALMDLDLDLDLDPALDGLVARALGTDPRARRVLEPLPRERRSRIVGRIPGTRRAALFDLCDLEIVAREALDAFLEESWRMTWGMTWEALAELGNAMILPARARLDRASGRKRELLVRLLAELEGKIGDARLEIVHDGDLLRARLLRDGEDLVVSLPLIPERADLVVFADAFASPRTVRLDVRTGESIDHALRHRLQMLLAELGFYSVRCGGSTVSRG
ncbi:MAG: hypothetical protein R3B13_21040 [Polyangiaceae bacterium]